MTKQISDEQTLFSIIKEVLQYKNSDALPLGVQAMDDCALLKISDEESIAITSDFVRGSGFTLFEMGLMNYYDAGYYLISANLSDIASVGATPIGLTTVIRYKDMDDNDFREVFKGMKAAADLHNAQIIGGDTGSYKADVFAATAFGLVKTKNALLRKNVQSGDLLCVTGTIGEPITALTYFKEVKKMGLTLSPEEENQLLHSWRRPDARIREGQILSNGLGHACQDISDGLKATIEQMSQLSGKTFTINEDKIPVSPITFKVAEFLQIDPFQIAMGASVDFELLFTIPKNKLTECQKKFAAENLHMFVIGEVNENDKNILLDKEGKEKNLPGTGWDQSANRDFIKETIER